ncbi:MAG TPA: peptidase M15 [Phycisphaerales bacterium]|nr:peptidase M15 [Phycisphaerales bacterium]
MTRDYEHFNYSEFDQPRLPGSGNSFMHNSFLEMLDDAREIAQVPFVITSGYRTLKYNVKIGGTVNSSHCKGFAADIAVQGSKSRCKILRGLILAGFTRIGIGTDFIHADNDPGKPGEVTWLY